MNFLIFSLPLDIDTKRSNLRRGTFVVAESKQTEALPSGFMSQFCSKYTSPGSSNTNAKLGPFSFLDKKPWIFLISILFRKSGIYETGKWDADRSKFWWYAKRVQPRIYAKARITLFYMDVTFPHGNGSVPSIYNKVILMQRLSMMDPQEGGSGATSTSKLKSKKKKKKQVRRIEQIRLE